MPNVCSICRLPAAVRSSVADMHRQGTTLRQIVVNLAEAGHQTSRDAVWRHTARCIAPPEEVDGRDDEGGLLVAIAVRDSLCHNGYLWNGLADRIAVRLRGDGLSAAAAVVQSSCVEMMRTPLESVPAGSLTRQLLEAEALTRAVTAFVRDRDQPRPDVALGLAFHCDRLGSDDLAESLRWAAEHPYSDPTAPAGADLITTGDRQ